MVYSELFTTTVYIENRFYKSVSRVKRFFLHIKQLSATCVFIVACRVVEYIDHLHQHFVDPVIVKKGSYQAPTVSSMLLYWFYIFPSAANSEIQSNFKSTSHDGFFWHLVNHTTQRKRWWNEKGMTDIKIDKPHNAGIGGYSSLAFRSRWTMAEVVCQWRV